MHQVGYLLEFIFDASRYLCGSQSERVPRRVQVMAREHKYHVGLLCQTLSKTGHVDKF